MSTHKTTLKQQINGDEIMRERKTDVVLVEFLSLVRNASSHSVSDLKTNCALGTVSGSLVVFTGKRGRHEEKISGLGASSTGSLIG